MKYFGTITDPKDLVNKEYIDDIAATKANTDGAYESMTVGNAEQLVSTVMVNDQTPYIYRTSGGSADIGNREYDTLVGGTVAWNQQVQNGNFASTNGWTPNRGTISAADNKLTFTAVSPGTNCFITQNIAIADHVYYWTYTVTPSVEVGVRLSVGSTSVDASTSAANVRQKREGINSVTSGEYVTLYVNSLNTMVNDDTIDIENIMCVDLTAMFGTAVANYAASLSSQEERVAYLRNLGFFTEDYYAYNAGELISVSGVSAHEMTGFNQWDEEWENCVWSETSNGVKRANANSLGCKNPIRIVGGATYYLTASNGNFYVLWYDDSMNMLSYVMVAHGSTIQAPSNACYMTFYSYNSYGTTYKNDICINLSWSGYRNGEYEPYVLHSYPLDSDLTLRGIPKLDADNNLYYDGDTYEADGTVTRRYGIVDLGSLNWVKYQSKTGVFYTSVDIIDMYRSGADNKEVPVKCSKYTTGISLTSMLNSSQDMQLAIGGTSTRVYLRDIAKDGLTNSEFKASMSGVVLVYLKNEPTTETADAFQSPQIVDDFGTERYVVAAQSGVEVPVGHSTDYPANLRDKLQHLPDLAESDGTYLIQQTDSDMALTLYVAPRGVPDAPTTDGTYVLKATVADGTATYQWVAE